MTSTFGSDTFQSPLRYGGQNYQFSPVYIRKRDPNSPFATSTDTRPPENLGYYPLGSWWINVVGRNMWVLRGINNNLADWVQIAGGAGGGGVQSILTPNGSSALADINGVVEFEVLNESMTINAPGGRVITFDALPVLSELTFLLPNADTVTPFAETVALTGTGVAITKVNPNTINFAATGGGAATSTRTPLTYNGGGAPINTPVVVVPNVSNIISLQALNSSVNIEGDSSTSTYYLDTLPVLSQLAIATNTFFGTDVVVPEIGLTTPPYQWQFTTSGGIHLEPFSTIGRIEFQAGPSNSANTFVTDSGTATPIIVGQVGTLNVKGIGSLQTSAPGSTNILKIKEPNCALFIVDPNIDYGTNDTIQDAVLDAVVAGGSRTVFIRPGTYTEDVILGANISLAAFEGDSDSATVILKGKLTVAVGGNMSISGIRLQTNGDYSVAQSAATVTFKDCYFDTFDHNSLLLSGGTTYIVNCKGEINDAGSTLFEEVGGGNVKFRNSIFSNTSGSQVTSTITNSFFASDYSTFVFPISTTGASTFGAKFSQFVCNGPVDSLALTFNGTGAESHIIRYCYIAAETLACVSLGAGNVTQMTDCELNTDAANAVTGAGTWFYSNIMLEGMTTGVNVATQTPIGLSGPRTQLVGGAQVMSGTGSPSGTVTAPKGSFFLRTDGSSATTRAYINTNSGTGWTGVMTVS